MPILIIFSIFILLFLVFFGAFFGIVWFPTKRKDYERIAKLAQLESEILFYDLGSGTGDMLFYLSEKYNINCVGIEISPLLYFYSKIRSLFHERVRIRYGNFFTYDLSKADVVFFFLYPTYYERLKKKLNNELKESTRIITACWSFKSSTPISINKRERGVTYYLYKKPL